MNLREKFQKVWENRNQIAEGLYNAYISNSEEIKAEVNRRMEICKSNQCGYWDPEGKGDKIVLKGQPGCNACGCTAPAKQACMSCNCGLEALQVQKLKEIGGVPDNLSMTEYRTLAQQKKAEGIDLGPDPLWYAIMEETQEQEIQKAVYEKQKEYRRAKQQNQ